MIPRYTRPAMADLWSAQTRYQIWLEIEALVLEDMARAGAVPGEAADAMRRSGSFDIARVEQLEATTHHEFVAFLTNVGESLGPYASYLHRGLTSSDVLDTGLAVQLQRAADLILEDMNDLLAALRRRAIEHAHTICAGRTHGIGAEPITFGLKLAGHYSEFQRNARRLREAREEIGFCKLSGAVGTYATLDPAVERFVAGRLGLKIEPVATQAIPRDRHAAFLSALALTAAAVERLAVEIRHLQRSEVAEVAEPFTPGQKGSSAMPHKRNPLLCENLTGLARTIRSTLAPALEDVVLWHERDMSHSSVERIILPEATTLLDFALHRLARIVDKMDVYPAVMKMNLDRLGGQIFSQSILLALVQAGQSREAAYETVQRHAMRARTGDVSFLDLVSADPCVTADLPFGKLRQLFNAEEQVRHVDTILARVLEL
jgi:adenylosuccinate lyase